MTNKLRNIERLVLSKLELDSRMPFSRLGKKIRKSQQQVSYTVNSLVEKGIIQKFYTLIDYSKLDVLHFRVYFKVDYIDEKKFEELVNYIISEPHTSGVVSCGGRYDLICTFFASNPSQFNKTLKAIMAEFPKQLKNYTILTTIVIRRFGNKYLLKNNSEIQEEFIGGDREQEDIDKIDIMILNELSENARISSVELGKKLDLTPKTIIKRIKKLCEKKIILGFKPLLNKRKIDYISTLLLIRYHNLSSELENKLIGYLKVHPNVVTAVKTLGEWDIEIEIGVKGRTELRKIEMDIRQKFALLIQQIESIPLYKQYKKNFFPRFLIGS